MDSKDELAQKVDDPVTARQKPLIYSAQRLTESQLVQTREGPEQAVAGDWLVTGVEGEVWPVSNATFQKRFKPIASSSGSYEKVPATVKAYRINEAIVLETAWGTQIGSAGDWLIESSKSDRYICASSVFSKTYDILD